MKFRFLPLILAVLTVSFLQAAPYLPKDQIQKDGDWTLVTVILNQGTRSQIVLGKIQYKNTEIIGSPGHLLETPLGRLVWRGPYDKGYWRGWITLDSDMDIKDVIPSELPTSTLGGLYYTKKKG